MAEISEWLLCNPIEHTIRATGRPYGVEFPGEFNQFFKGMLQKPDDQGKFQFT
jgi:hypothetical protein